MGSSIYHDPFEDTESRYESAVHDLSRVVPSTTIRLRILKVSARRASSAPQASSIYHDPFEDTERVDPERCSTIEIASSIYHDPFEDTESGLIVGISAVPIWFHLPRSV